MKLKPASSAESKTVYNHRDDDDDEGDDDDGDDVDDHDDAGRLQMAE